MSHVDSRQIWTAPDCCYLRYLSTSTFKKSSLVYAKRSLSKRPLQAAPWTSVDTDADPSFLPCHFLCAGTVLGSPCPQNHRVLSFRFDRPKSSGFMQVKHTFEILGHRSRISPFPTGSPGLHIPFQTFSFCMYITYKIAHFGS